MRATVAKHRYWKGKPGVKSVGEYSKYLQHRQGPDREPGGRKFFDKDNDVSEKDIMKAMEEQKLKGVAAHELILSPGVNRVDAMAYTRELMENLAKAKGQELEWVAVAHTNTEHLHVHVLILGETKEHKPVRLGKNEHKQLREWGDKYLEREHFFDRFMDREIDSVLDRKYEQDRGDELFNRLLYGVKGGKEEQSKVKEKPEPKVWSKEEEVEKLPKWEQIVTKDGEVLTKYSDLADLKGYSERLKEKEEPKLDREQYKRLWSWIGTKEKAGEDYFERQARAKFREEEEERQYQGPSSFKDERKVVPFKRRERGEKPESRTGYLDYRRKPRSQRLYEERGRRLEEHAYYELSWERRRLKDLMERDPNQRKFCEEELDRLSGYEKEIQQDFGRVDLDELLGWKDPSKEKDKDKAEEKAEPNEGQKEAERLEKQRAEEARVQAEAQQRLEQERALKEAEEAAKASKKQASEFEERLDEDKREGGRGYDDYGSGEMR